MKKRITYLTALLIALILCLNGCIGIGSDATSQTQFEITDQLSEEEYYEKYHDPEWEYYGKYGDCFVSFFSDGSDMVTELSVGGLVFICSGQGAGFNVFYEDRFYSLSEAYESGFLNDEQLEDLHLYHSEMKPLNIHIEDSCKITRLYEYEVRKLLYSYYSENSYKDEYSRESINKYGFYIHCLGKFGNSYVFFAEDPVYYFYTTNCGTVNYGGYEFTFPNGRPMYFYKDGELYLFSVAYKKGLVDEAMIPDIHKAYVENYDEIHGGHKYFERTY